MKPPAFAYAAPTTLEQALQLLHEHAGDAIVLAGGQSLIPALNFRVGSPELLVDINRLVPLGSITHDQDRLSIGALTRHTELVTSAVVRHHLPVLSDAAQHIGHTPIRNRGTAGGSIAHADPAAELPAILAAIGGEIELHSAAGSRTIPFDEFVLGPYLTTRQPDELLTALHLPLAPDFDWAITEVSRRSGDFALAGAVAGIAVHEGTCCDARIALFGLEPVPRRITDLEQALIGAPITELGTIIANTDFDLEIALPDPGETGYRRHLARVTLETAVERIATGEDRSA